MNGDDTRLYKLRITVELVQQGSTLVDVFSGDVSQVRTQELHGDLLDLEHHIEAAGASAAGMAAVVVQRERERIGEVFPY